MKIRLLGTGTPAPSLTRQSSGYVVEVGDDLIVFDHGPGAHHRFLEAGYRSVDVSHVFLTHLHYDHFMDYPRLIMNRWDQGAGKIDELDVYGPAPLARITDQLFSEAGIYGLDITARTQHRLSLDIHEARGGALPRLRPTPRVREVVPGDVIADRDWRVSVAEGWHAQPYLTCYGYRLEADGSTLCYSGDSGGVCPEIIELARDCDVLIHMTHFFSGTEPSDAYRKGCGNHLDVAAVAQQAGAKTVVLTHITEQIDQPGVRERIVRDMAQVYEGIIIWGEDLMEIPLAVSKLGRID